MNKLIVITGIALASCAALAGNAPLQLSLTPDIALLDRSERVEGLSIGLWGENPESALSLGLVNGSTDDSAGLSLALLVNYADNYRGVQLAPVNYTRGSFLGWQAGVVNDTDGAMRGVQTGVVNYAGHLTGVQIGIINYAATADTGVQIGVLNIIPTNAWFTDLPDELAPGMVFVNWRF